MVGPADVSLHVQILRQYPNSRAIAALILLVYRLGMGRRMPSLETVIYNVIAVMLFTSLGRCALAFDVHLP
jgi:hypothetical protein